MSILAFKLKEGNMQWYKIELTQTQVANDFLSRLNREIQDKILYFASDQSVVRPFAAFSSKGENDCGYAIYLSPALANLSPEIIFSCNAEPCEPPVEGLVSVFVSGNDDEAAWKILRTSNKLQRKS